MNDKENIFENTDEVKIIVRFNKQLIITRKNNINCCYMYDGGWLIDELLLLRGNERTGVGCDGEDEKSRHIKNT